VFESRGGVHDMTAADSKWGFTDSKWGK